MKKLFSLLAALALLTAGYAADVANDVIISQRKPDNSGNIQRNVPFQNAITSASLPSWLSGQGLGVEDTPNFTGVSYGVTTPGSITGLNGALTLAAAGTAQNISLITPVNGQIRVLGSTTLPTPQAGFTYQLGPFGTIEGVATTPIIQFRRTNGSVGTETAIASGNSIGNFGFKGSTGVGTYSGNTAVITANATENWTTGANGTRLAFQTTPNLGTGATDRLYIDQSGAVQLPSTNTAGLQLYNTADQVTNYERLEAIWSANTAIIRATRGGSGTFRDMQLGNGSSGGFNIRGASSTSGTFDLFGNTSTTVNQVFLRIASSLTWQQTSGSNAVVSIIPIYNQVSGTAANTDLLINRTETAVGSGTQLFADFQVGGSSRLSFSNGGSITSTTGSLNMTRLNISGNRTAGNQGTGGVQNSFMAATFTDSSTAGSGVAAIQVATALGQPTFAATNTLVTTTDGATLYINNAPANGTNNTITNPWALWVDAGNVRLDGGLFMPTVGQTMNIKQGANGKAGTVTLVAGTATVNNTSVTANSVILLTPKTVGGTAGDYRVTSTVVGTSFTVTGIATDTSTYNYVIFEATP